MRYDVLFKDKKITKMIQDICDEHYTVAKPIDSNMGYLWYMYNVGPKKGYFKPFIFMSEINLLIKMGYLTEEERDNMKGMIVSPDEENIYMAALSLLTLRKKRIKDLGIWTVDNPKYSELNYTKDIINPEVFNKQ